MISDEGRLARFETYCEVLLRDVAEIKVMLKGKEDTGGLIARVDRLEEQGKSREWVFRAVVIASGTASLAALLRWVIR